MLGFSVHYTNPFSERLERRSAAMERHHCEATMALMLGVRTLHDGVDAALGGDGTRHAAAVEEGLDQLRRCNDHLTGIGEELVRLRVELFERESLDPSDPLIAREPFFTVIDYERTYRELLADGAALPHRVFWDDVVARLRDGGARGALRLLDRHLRELQSDLHALIAECEAACRLPLREGAARLHGATLGLVRVDMGFTRFQTAASYCSVLCERASLLYERQVAGQVESMAS